MEKIPILKLGDYLLVTIQVDLYDQLALNLEEDLINSINQNQSKGVLIDVSSVGMIDTFMGRILVNIASMAKILDAKSVVVGMQPAVAITLVELGLTLSGVDTALNVEKGIDMLNEKNDRNGTEEKPKSEDDIT